MHTSISILITAGLAVMVGAWKAPWHRAHLRDMLVREPVISTLEQVKATPFTPSPPSISQNVASIRRRSDGNYPWSPYLHTPHYRGINVVNGDPLNDWKSYNNATGWNRTFGIVKSLPGGFNAVRLYSTTEGGDAELDRHLELALPAAKVFNISLHVGVWSGGDDNQPRFQLEKAALDRALAANGCENIIAVSVGNEDLYLNLSKETTGKDRVPVTSVNLLIDQINEISTVLDNHGCCNVPVTHTDTTGQWQEPQVLPLLQAVDFVTINVFPYWSGNSIADSNTTFWSQVKNFTNYAAQHGKEVWIGETGWPYNGTNVNAAQPSRANQQTYFKEVGCSMLASMNSFYYVQDDNPNTAISEGPAFGIWDELANAPILDMTCP